MQQGYVTKLGTKNGVGKNGPWTLYSVQMDGAKWLGAGFDKPVCNEGDYINYDIVQKGQYENIEGISVASAPSVGANSPAVNSNSGGQAVGSKPVNTTQLSIQYQSSRNAAIETLGVMLSNDVVKLPAKQADKYDAAMALIEELSANYFLKLESVIEDGGVSTGDAIPQPTS